MLLFYWTLLSWLLWTFGRYITRMEKTLKLLLMFPHETQPIGFDRGLYQNKLGNKFTLDTFVFKNLASEIKSSFMTTS